MVSNDRPRWFLHLADVPIVAMSVGLVVLLVRTILGRMNHGFDLEWMEGGMLLHAARVAEGLPLYITPSTEFIPFIYPPMYPWIVGGLSWLGLPLDYALGRAVSVLGVALAGIVLALAVRKEGGGWSLALGGSALFWATYPACGAFFDLVRNDGVLLGFLAASLFAVRCGAVRIGGLLLTAAFLTKHTAALYGLCSLWWLNHHLGRRSALSFVCWSVLPALTATAWLTLGSEGLFWTYVIDVPAAHPFVAERFFWTAPKELVMALPWLVGVMLVSWFVLGRSSDRGHRFWFVHGAMAVFLSALMRGHHGGYTNVLMPGLWIMALWGVLAVHRIRKQWPNVWLRVATACLIGWQLWAAQWSLGRYVPTAADAEAGHAIVDQLRVVEGPILAPWQPWMPVQAGKNGSVALIALWDIDHKDGPLYEEAQVIAQALGDKHFAAVLTAKAPLKRGLKQNYKVTRMKRPRGAALYPKTGWKVRPHTLWVPKND